MAQEREVYTTNAAQPGGGGAKAVQSKDSGKLLPVYRFYHVKGGQHHWTTDKKESDRLQSLYKQKRADWRYEGIAFYMPSKSATPVYRLWNPTLGDHLWTTDKAEKDRLVKLTKQRKADWRYEGIGFYSSDAKKVPVYRFFDVKNGYHHWTADKAEKEWLVGLYKKGKASYKYESVSYYAAAPEGWFQMGGKWTFWKGGKQVKGKLITTSKAPSSSVSAVSNKYYLDAAGNLAAGKPTSGKVVWKRVHIPREWYINGVKTVYHWYKWECWINGKKVKNRWVVTATAPAIKPSSLGPNDPKTRPTCLQRYWIDATGSLAVGRLIDGRNTTIHSMGKDKRAGYYAYATSWGAVARNTVYQVSGDKLKVDNDGRIANKATDICYSFQSEPGGRYTLSTRTWYYFEYETWDTVKNATLVAGGVRYTTDRNGVLNPNPAKNKNLINEYGSPSLSEQTIVLNGKRLVLKRSGWIDV